MTNLVCLKKGSLGGSGGCLAHWEGAALRVRQISRNLRLAPYRPEQNFGFVARPNPTPSHVLHGWRVISLVNKGNL